MTKEGLRKGREILENLRKPKTPSDDLVSIVQEISESNENQNNKDKDEIAAKPAPEANT